MLRLLMLNSSDKALLLFKIFNKNKGLFDNTEIYNIIPDQKVFGFFSYVFDATKNSAYIHVLEVNRKIRALSHDEIPNRKRELTLLIKHIKDNCPKDATIICKSWLFSYPNFKVIFPQEFQDSLKLTEYEFGGDGIWGQFVAYNGFIKEDLMKEFTENLKNAETLTDAYDSFPLKCYIGQCNIPSC